MSKCWDHQQENRPSFKDINKELNEMLSDQVRKLSIYHSSIIYHFNSAKCRSGRWLGACIPILLGYLHPGKKEVVAKSNVESLFKGGHHCFRNGLS